GVDRDGPHVRARHRGPPAGPRALSGLLVLPAGADDRGLRRPAGSRTARARLGRRARGRPDCPTIADSQLWGRLSCFTLQMTGGVGIGESGESAAWAAAARRALCRAVRDLFPSARRLLPPPARRWRGRRSGSAGGLPPGVGVVGPLRRDPALLA